MKRLLLVHPFIDPPGGGNGVAAMTIEALREHFDVTVATWQSPHLDRINRFFGTSLRSSDFRVRLVPAAVRLWVDPWPARAALLRHSVMSRHVRALLARENFDVVMTTQNEMDFGRRGIQYVHFPEGYLPRPDYDLTWVHRALPWAVAGYRRLSGWVASRSDDGIRRNLTLVNSDWTGDRFRARYGGATVTVHPPVSDDIPERPHEGREPSFLCVGRLAPEKRIDMVMSILAAVRRRHPSVKLHIVGSPDHPPAHARRILRLAAREASWVTVHLDLSRAALTDLMTRCQYGISGMAAEHFGMGVAELQRAGALVFVPRGGGQVEIVDGDDRVIYDGPREAVDKIDRVLGEPSLRASILSQVAARRDRYTASRFRAEIREAVGRFSEESG